MIFRRKEEVVNSVVAIAVAQALTEKSTEVHLKWINLISSTWTPSLFRNMGFVTRMRTTDKPEIPDPAVMEAKLLFQHQIASLVEEHKIPPSLILNFDQTTVKYVPVSNSTFAKKDKNMSLSLVVPSKNWSLLRLASLIQISSYQCNSHIKETREEVFRG